MAIVAGQVTVDATVGGVLIYTATDNTVLTINNTDATAANTVVLGPSGVTTTTGYILAGNAGTQIWVGAGQTLYGIRGTANSVVVSFVAKSGS